jgi:predicted RNA-binding protein YlqC (UPF0109 family)
MSTIDQQFVEFVVKSLVSKPDAVHVDRRIDEKGVLLELTVDPEDLGRVIGKRGATAQSLRTLLRALGTKNDARYNLKIIDNGFGPTARPREDVPVSADNGSEPEVTDSNDTDSSNVADSTDDTDSNSSEDVTDATDDTDIDLDSNEEQPTEGSDRIERARKELEELDDLDV